MPPPSPAGALPVATPGQELLGLKTVDDVASYFGVSSKRLQYHLYWHPTAYRTFDIPKRSGGTRLIESPPVPVIVFQKKLARALNELYQPKVTAHGFIRGKSIVTNARHHLGAHLILNIDLADFFHSIHFGRVFGLLQKPPFSLPPKVAAVLAHLCCYKKRLPQGAPTSPILSNLVCRGLDTKLSQLGKTVGVRYSRYADDISFSTKRSEFPKRIMDRGLSDDAVVLAEELRAIIKSEGFTVNDKKTRVLAANVRQVVTGVTINVKPNVHWSYTHSLRGALWCWRRLGYKEADRRFRESFDKKPRHGAQPELSHHIEGKLAFLTMVRGEDDPVASQYRLEFAHLAERTAVLRGAAARRHHLLSQALWVVLGLDSEGIVLSNGTAAYIEGLGFVTSEHVISDPQKLGIARHVLARTDQAGTKHDFTVRASDPHLDIAVLESQSAKPWAALQARTVSGPQVGEEVLLAGFPNWTPGHEPRIEPGHIAQLRTVSARRLAQITCAIHDGNSGGPVLGADGRVVAIATYGATSPILPHGVVEIRHALELIG
jgi:RNA-directed DNA polymerase